MFGLGKQVVRSSQLLKGYFSRTHVICITYCWEHDKVPRILTWGDNEDDEADMLRQFDLLIEEADVIIGKNSDRFDNKHINFQRMIMGNTPMPEWTMKADDLEKQMRRYFNMPSHSLDYITEQLGYGGKMKMEFGDWMAILLYRMCQVAESYDNETLCHDDWLNVLCGDDYESVERQGQAALKRMFTYGKRDVKITRQTWKHCEKHFTPRHSMATWMKAQGAVSKCRFGDNLFCKHCGSGEHLSKNRMRAICNEPRVSTSGKTIYQLFQCTNGEKPGFTHYAGRAVPKRNGKYGDMS